MQSTEVLPRSSTTLGLATVRHLDQRSVHRPPSLTLLFPVFGSRFHNKLDGMINGIISCLLSSRNAFDLTFPNQTAAAPGSEVADPSVLALWRGEVDPQTGRLDTGLPFATSDLAVKFGSMLLRSGRPSIKTENDDQNVDTFVQQCLRKISPEGGQELFTYRLPFRRMDSVIDPSSLQYVPQEISFGPKEKWIGDLPNDINSLQNKAFMFGTGWSTTLAAETVQIAGKYLEAFASLSGTPSANINEQTRLEEYQAIPINNKQIAKFISESYMGHVHLR